MKKTVISKDAYGNEYECPIEDLNVRIGVYAIIIKDDKLLLARQWNGYSMIGGGVEKGETLEEAYTREVKEETGLDAVAGKLVYHATTYFKRDKQSQAYQSHQFYFTTETFDREIRSNKLTASEKTYTYGDPEWVPFERLGSIEFRHSIGLKKILDSIRQN